MTRPPPLFLLLPLLLAACAHSPRQIARHDQRVFAAQERASLRALDAVEDSLVLFKVEETGETDDGDRNRSAHFSGIVLTPEGHLLAPYTIRPGSDNRIEAYLQRERYLARAVHYDDSIGMTVVKIEPRTPLVPLEMDVEHELHTGQNAYTVIGSDETGDFERFVFQAFSQGVIEGRFRQYSLSPLPNRARGAPLYNQTGELVGLVNQSNAWILTDLLLEVDELLAKATGDAGDDEDDDAWFGAVLTPVNPDYARANDLPRSALWLTYVFEEGSAAKAGLQTGDLVVALNGEPLRLSGGRAYRYFLQALRPRTGDPFTVTVLRDGKKIQKEGVIDRREEPDTLRAEDLGITVSEVDESMAVRLNLHRSEGVVVTHIETGSPAATGRSFGRPLLRPRDLLVSIGGIPTPDMDAFGDALERIRRENRKELLVHFWRGPVSGYEALNLRIGDRDNGDDS